MKMEMTEPYALGLFRMIKWAKEDHCSPLLCVHSYMNIRRFRPQLPLAFERFLGQYVVHHSFRMEAAIDALAIAVFVTPCTREGYRQPT